MYKMTSKATMTIKYQQPQPTSSVVDRYRYIVLVQWMHKSLMTMNGLPAIRYWWMVEWTDKTDGLTYGRYGQLDGWIRRMNKRHKTTTVTTKLTNKSKYVTCVVDLQSQGKTIQKPRYSTGVNYRAKDLEYKCASASSTAAATSCMCTCAPQL